MNKNVVQQVVKSEKHQNKAQSMWLWEQKTHMEKSWRKVSVEF